MSSPRWRTIRTGIVALLALALFATTTLLAGSAEADDNPATDTFTMACTVSPSFTPDTVTESGVQGVVAGETVTFANEVTIDPGTIYQDILQRPDGSIYYASYLQLIKLPSNLVIDPASVEFTIDGLPVATVAGSSPDPVQFVLDSQVIAGELVYSLLFPGDEAAMLADQSGEGVPSWTVAPAAQTFALSFDALMPLGSVQGAIEDGSECFTSLSTGPSNRDTDRPRTAVVVVEPEMTITKTTSLDNAYQAGQVASFDLIAAVPEVDSATQTHAVAAPQDVVIVDNVPAGLAPSDAAGTLIADGAVTAGGGIYDAGASTITYTIGAIAPGTSTAITELFLVDPANSPADVITNEACASFTSLGELGEARQDAGCDDASIVISSESPTVEKRALRIPDGADLEQYGIGLPYWYEVTVDFPAGSSYENFTILDNLPDGLIFNSYVSAVCLPAGPTCPNPIIDLAPTLFPGGNGTGIGWYPDSMPFDANARTITVRYEVELAPTYASGDPLPFNDLFENELSINWNTVDRLGDVPPATAQPPAFDLTIDTSDIVEYDRPVLVIDKVVDTSDGVFADTTREAWDYEIGDTATFTLEITNEGSTDAYEILYVDQPVGFAIDLGSLLIDGSDCAAASAICVAAGDGFSATLPGPIAPGQTVTLTYDAVPTSNGDIDNAASIPSYADEFDTPYTETPTDTVGLVIPDPELNLTKSNGPIDTGYANTIGTEYPFVFTVTNVSATTAYNVQVTDTPPAELCTFDGGLDASAVGVTETAAGVWQLDNPLPPGQSVSFTAWLRVCDQIEPGTYVNTADLTWFDLNDDLDSSGATYADTDTADIILTGPAFEVEKGPALSSGAVTPWSIDLDVVPPDPNDLEVGELVGGAWTVVVTNTGTAPIGGLEVFDVMPDSLEYLPGTATATWIPAAATDVLTDTSTAAGSGAVWEADGYTDTVELTIGQLAPGAEVRITIPFVHNGNAPADGNLTRVNTVEVRNDNLTFDPEVHTAQGEYTLIPVEAGPRLSKTVSPASPAPGIGAETTPGQPGQEFDFAIEVIMPTKETTVLHDVWVLDTLPDGLSLVNEPAAGAVPAAPADGWTVTCTSPDCDATGGGLYLGSQPGANGTTELAWWFDEIPTDVDEEDRVYVITFRVVVDSTYSDGSEVIDGFDEPLVNIAEPIYNRDASLPGGGGEVYFAPPVGVPDPDTFERIYPLDPADIDIETPRLDMDKTITNLDGDEVQEVTAGDTFIYTITAINGGSGDAYDIDINDTLGTPEIWFGDNYMAWDIGTLTVDPPGVVCNVYDVAPPAPTQNMLCEFPGPLQPGEEITITYEATTVPNDEFYAQTSTNNFDPMIIRNQANAAEYWEAAGQGGNQYSTGDAVTRIFAFTPVPEIDASCVSGLVEAPVGSDVQFWAVFGNGDRVDINGNPGGDQTLTPFPTEDLNNDGFPDAGLGYDPEVRITLQDRFTFNGVTGTGPGAGDPTYQTYSPFPAPDQIVSPGDQGAGTYTLVWDATTLDNIPHSPNHSIEGNYLPHNGGVAPIDGSFLPHYALLIDVTKTENGGGSIWYELKLEDADGNIDRGTSVGEPFTFIEKDRHGCPGGPPPRAWKYPDVEDGVRLAPGEADEFVIYLQQPDENPVPSVFTDLLPAGLTYAGDLPLADPRYAVATIDTVPASWPLGATLEDYFTSSTTDAAGNTSLVWNPPDLDQGLASDPNAGGADTRHVIRVPIVADDPTLFPNEFVVNKFEWNANGTIRQDSGAMLTEGEGLPSIDKRAVTSAGLYGEEFEYVIDVTIPAGYAGNDVFIYDQINRYSNWDSSPWNLQTDGNWMLGTYIFPFASSFPPPPSVAGELNTRSYPYTPAEFELAPVNGYLSAVCDSGCNLPSEVIDIVPLPPLPVATAGTLPTSTSNSEVINSNGALGWYLGDITPAGQDRVLEIRYRVAAPTLEEQRQRVVDLNPTNWPLGTADPEFDNRNSYWFETLSQVRHPNLVQIRDFGTDNAAFGVWEGAGDDEWMNGNTAWHDELSSSTTRNTADEVVIVSYPIVDMTKRCGAMGSTGDPLVATQPEVTPLGTPNVECTVELTNRSPVAAFNVNVTDEPLLGDDLCVVAAVTHLGEITYTTAGNENASNPWYPERSANGTGVKDPTDPTASTYACDTGTLITIPSTGIVTTDAGGFPLDWDLQIGASATETLTYQTRIDGWTNRPYTSRDFSTGNWNRQGMWINEATLAPWAATDGGDLIGDEVVYSDEVGFEGSLINVSKTPYPEGRNPCADAHPFIQWNQAPEAEWVNLSIWRNHPAGDQPIIADGYGDPFAGLYWTEGDDYCVDPLQPPDRDVPNFNWPSHLRGLPLNLFNQFSTSNTWFGYRDDIALYTPGAGQGWLLDPRNIDFWSPDYYATPTMPYRWSIDVRVDGLQYLSDIEIIDTLPVGWEFVPGSATIVDGVWALGNANGTSWDWERGIESGYGEIPLPDPVLANNPDGTPACHADNNFHSGGQTMTWDFERDGGAMGDQPWQYQYVDASTRIATYTDGQALGTAASTIHYGRDRTGWSTKGGWVRIHYYATPLMEVFQCDPDQTSSDPFLMENNVQVNAVRDNPLLNQSIEITDRRDMVVPIANPINFEKLPDDDFVPDETTAYFEIRFENNLDVPVFDLTIADELRASIPPLAGGGYACATATATLDDVPFVLDEIQCDNPLTQATDIAWLIPQIDPGQVVVITIPINIPTDETNSLQWNNTASTTVKEYFDSPFEDDGHITVLNPSPAPEPSKSVTPNPATINDVVEYEVTFTADALQVFMDLAYIDVVPDGLTFLNHVDVTCTGGCPNGYDPSDVFVATPQVNVNGTTTLMWWFGDMPGSNQPHTWTMTYKARVDESYVNGDPVLDEQTLLNEVTGYASHENLIDGTPAGLLDPSAWDASEHPPSGPGSAVLDIEEPELEIAKTAVPSDVPTAGSSTIDFIVSVTNVGGMDAHNVTVTDTPNAALENIVMDPAVYPTSVVTQGWTPLAPEVGWFITTLAAGETAVFTYTAEVVDTFLVDGIWVAENDASVDEFWGRPGAEPEPGDRSYVGGETSTQVPLTAPEVDITKNVGNCVDDFQFAEIGESLVWCLTVSNPGDATANNVVVTERLPYLWTYDAGSATADGVGPFEPAITAAGGVESLEWSLGDLAPGESVQIEFTATPGDGSPEVVTNWASVVMTQADGTEYPASISQASDRDPAVAAIGRYGLEIAKTPDEQQWPHIPDGGTVEWDLTITNPATDTTNTDLVVVDFLPAPLTFDTSFSADPRVGVPAVGIQGAGPGGTTEITWTITDLGPGETIVIELDALSTGGEVQNQWYVNDVQVTSNEISDLVANQAKVRFYGGASVGDFAWEDTNADGIQDSGETGVNGVIVTLLDGNGDPLYQNPNTGMIYTAAEWAALSPAEQADTPPMQVTTQNDPDTGEPGWYEFDGLPAGTYQINFDPSPTGLYPTQDDQGADDAADSDANRFTGNSHVFSLVPGQHNPTIDIGLVSPEQYEADLAQIDIEKWTEGVQADTQPGPALTAGDPLAWTYQVTNTGATSLAQVQVGDNVEGDVNCDIDGNGSWDNTNIIPLLLPGESRNCYVTGVVDGEAGGGSGQYANTGAALGEPVVPDFDLCGCDPDDPSTWPTDPGLNQPATDLDGQPLPQVQDLDPSHYFAADPSIDIEKATNGDDADVPTGPVLLEGDAVTWTYVVINDGNTALSNVTVSDDQGVSVVCDVNDDGVFDDASGAVIGFLGLGESVECQGTGVAIEGAYTNIGDVAGDPVLPDIETCGCDITDPDTWPDGPDGYVPIVDLDGDELPPVSDEDPSNYLGVDPSVDIEKFTNEVQSDTVPGEPIPVDADVTWSYVVTNTGTTALVDLVVTDDVAGVIVDCDPGLDVSNTIALLVPGESITCEAQGVAEPGAYNNTGDVTGTPALPTDPNFDPEDPESWSSDPDDYTATGQDDVDDADPSHYFGVEGGLDLEKSTNGVDADVEPGVALAPGDPVVWTYTVTNTSTVAVTGSTVTDSDIGDAIDCGDGDNVIPLLLPGESVVCTSTVPAVAVAGQYQNDSDVSGTGALPSTLGIGDVDVYDPTTWPTDPKDYEPFVDEPFTDEDPSHYFALDGGIDLEKSTNGLDSDIAPGGQILEDGVVTWTYAVTNNTNTTLINVFVEDSDPAITVDCGGGSDRIPVLAIGETVACTAMGVAELGQYQNDSDVSGTPAIIDPENPNGPSDDPNSYVPTGHGPVTDEDPSHYFGADPSIDIEKATNGDDADDTVGPVLAPDDAVTWTYLVTNNGNVAMIDATVVDNPAESIDCGDGTNVIALLAPGDSATCTATGVAVLGQFENVADVTGTPAQLIDPENGDPADPDAYEPSGLNEVDDLDPSHYVAHDGDVIIVKMTNERDANEEPGVFITIGDPVDWTYNVANTSNTPLVDLVVTDDDPNVIVDCGDGTNTIALLMPGATFQCTATGTATEGQYTNIGAVTGTPAQPDGDGGFEPIPGAEDVSDDDPSNYFGNVPSVDVEKSTNGLDADTPVGPILAPGDLVTWTYTVTNDGDTALADVTVVDDQGEDVDCGDGSGVIAFMLPGDIVNCTATGAATLGQYMNNATVTGTPIQLDDPNADPSNPDNYSPSGQPEVGDDDPSHYIAHDGAIMLEKFTNGVDADVPTGPTIDIGDDVTWTYVVTNTSNTTLINIVVTDDDPLVFVDCGDGSNSISELSPGATRPCTATGTTSEGQYTNLGSVVGTPAMPDPLNGGFVPIPGADPVNDDDPSHYIGADPAIDIEKATNADDADATTGPALYVGDVVTWTYEVTNSGQVALADITVTDDQGEDVDCGDGSPMIALLLPGNSVTCTATGSAEFGPYENIADVTGTPVQIDDLANDPNNPDNYVPTGQEDVVDDDPSHYYGHDASLEIEKFTNGVDADVAPGVFIDPEAPITWTYEVTNTSNTPLIDVIVTDDQGERVDCGDDSNRIALLLPGQTVTCTATGEASTGLYTNVGDATGTPAMEDPENPDDYVAIPGADPVSDDDPSNHTGAEASVDIEKATNGEDADTVFGPIVEPGSAITWTFDVTNTGLVPLVDLVVNDDDPAVSVDCGNGDNTIAMLLPGQSLTCQATGTAGLGSYANIGDVVGTPAQPSDPTDGCCDPADPDTWPTDPDDYDPSGQDPVVDDDPSHYVSNDGDIVIEKATNGEDADLAPGPVVSTDSDVTWTYAVVNTSLTPLMDVTVSDDDPLVTVDCGDGSNVIPVLLSGETRTCTATGTATSGLYTNIGSVTGQPAEEDPNDPGTYVPLPGVDPVSDDDPSHYTGANPSVGIEKATNGEDADELFGPVIAVGDDVTWTYVVTNDGEVPLANLAVADDDPSLTVDCGDGTNVIGFLLPGASASCEATGSAEVGSYANVGSVTGTPVQPSDPIDGCCDPADSDSWPTDPDIYEPTGQDPVDDDDPSHYVGSDGALIIEKATNGVDGDTAPGVILDPGAAVTWTYMVLNTSTTPVVDLVVSDDQGLSVDCGEGDNTIAVLLPGESHDCTATGTAIAGSYVNIGSVVGQPAVEDPDNPDTYVPIPGEDPVSADDPSHHLGLTPSVTVEKATNGDDADTTIGPLLTLGEFVEWTYEVTNDGETPLIDLIVGDNDPALVIDCGGGSNAIALLVPGASVTCTATGSAELGEYENIGSVIGTPVWPTDPETGDPFDPSDPDCGCDPNDPSSWPTNPDAYDPTPQQPAVDDDPSHYVAHDGGVMMQKSTNGADADEAPGPLVAPGEAVTWTYTVANTSDTPLVDVVLTDDQGEAIDCGQGNNLIALLLPGEVRECTATGIAQAGQYTNIGTVSGTPGQPDPNNPGSYIEIPGQEPITDEDPSNYFGGAAVLDIEKSTNGDDADEAPGPVILEGDPVTWTYVVTNRGLIAAIDVTVRDDDSSLALDCGDGTATIGVLAPGQTVTCTSTGVAGEVEYRNVGSVIGTPAIEDPSDPGVWIPFSQADPAGDDDPSHYDGQPLELDLALIKRLASSTSADSNGLSRHTFTVEVINQGSVAATDIEIVDHLPEGMSLDDDDWTDNGDGTVSMMAPGPLAPGQSMMVEIDTMLNGFGTFENVAGLAGANAEHPVSGDPLDLSDVDSDFGDPMQDTVVDNVTDNSNGDDDDSDVAQVTMNTDGTPSRPSTGPVGEPFSGFPNSSTPSGPQPFNTPSSPLAYTGSNALTLAMVGMVLMLIGGAFMLIARRRREDDLDDGLDKIEALDI